MGKFDDWWSEKLSEDLEQAVDYIKLAVEEGDLELLRMSIDNSIKAGYSSYIIIPINSIEQANIQLKQQALEAKI